MILTRTPLRVSLAGGGTDLPAVYRELGVGAVTSLTVDKYVYICVNPKYDGQVRVSHYDRNEVVADVAAIEHELARECCRLLDVTGGVEIVSVADVPAGSGLGSSAAYCVGLLNALHSYRQEGVPPGQLAEEACTVELDVLGRTVGKQDQYAAAFGGLRFYVFMGDGTVRSHLVKLPDLAREALEKNLLLFAVGGQHDAAATLAPQQANVAEQRKTFARLVDLAWWAQHSIGWACDFKELGEIVSRGWRYKRSLASGVVSNGEIDGWLARGLEAGAYGGKLLGAGGAGFLLLVAAPAAQPAVREALGALREVPWRLEPEGSRVVYRD